MCRLEDVPEDCFSSDHVVRTHARFTFRKVEEGKFKHERRHWSERRWRDDGVGFVWSKKGASTPARREGTSSSGAQEQKIESSTARQDSPGLPLAQRSHPAQTSHPTTSTAISSLEPGDTNETTRVISYPAQFATVKTRQSEKFSEWCRQEIRSARSRDVVGKPSFEVSARRLDHGLELKLKSIPPGAQIDRETYEEARQNELSVPFKSGSKSPERPSKRKIDEGSDKLTCPSTLPPESISLPNKSLSKAQRKKRRRAEDASLPNSLTLLPPGTKPIIDLATPLTPTPTPTPPPIHRVGPTLDSLQKKMQEKLTAIDNWSNILVEYPDRASEIQKQVDRMQDEIFQLQGRIASARAGAG